ncbi:MAG: hypothetical protein DRI81_07185 [Chloroflexi bacterium]|nr:MAG: hypothetical protein DRI81_07185 [Chloroflexota bacterium]
MNAKQQITNRIREVYQVEPYKVFKGLEHSGYGWYYQPFGENAIYLGKNKNDAIAELGNIAIEWREAR